MSSETPAPNTPTDSTPDAKNDVTERSSYLDGISADVLQTPGRRTTGTIEHVVIEAELVEAGKDLDNPAVPAQAIMTEALAKLERRDLEPAWQVCRGDGE
jgi:hypothetical protein